MSILISIITAAFVSWWLNEIMLLPKYVKALNRKPFNCIPCLAAWTGLLLYYLPYYIRESLLVLISSGIVAIILEVKMKKL